MAYYRIKQIDDNQFIPQTTDNFITKILYEWNGLEEEDDGKIEKWYSGYIQTRYCIVDSLEKAKQIIERHKLHKQTYPKYHSYK